MPRASGDISLGQHGLIRAGQDIPVSFTDVLGVEHPTDMDRLRQLGVVELEPARPAARVKRGEQGG